MAPAPTRPAPTRAGRAGAAVSRRRGRSRDDEDYDSEYDDLPPPRRKSNSSSIVVLGIIGAIAFLAIMWAMFGSSISHNEQVFIHSEALADSGKYQAALSYAEENGDPDGVYYWRVEAAIRDYRKRLKAARDVKHNEEAMKHFNYQIWQKQGIAENFRAKHALPDDEVVRLLREFLVKYRGTPQARELIHSEHGGMPDLREAMREHASEDLKASDVMGQIQTEIGILQTRGQYGQAVQDLEWVRDMNRLCMTGENWSQLRGQIDDEIAQIKIKATAAFKEDELKFKSALRDRERKRAWAVLDMMKEKYNGIADLLRRIKELQTRL